MTAAKKIVTVLIALLAVFCFCFLEQTFAFCFSRVYGCKGGWRLVRLAGFGGPVGAAAA